MALWGYGVAAFGDVSHAGYPAGFATKKIETNGTTIHTRVGGQPVAVLNGHLTQVGAVSAH